MTGKKIDQGGVQKVKKKSHLVKTKRGKSSIEPRTHSKRSGGQHGRNPLPVARRGQVRGFNHWKSGVLERGKFSQKVNRQGGGQKVIPL